MGLLESAACGTPVVSTNVGMAKDLITDRLTGFIVERIEAESYQRKLNFV